MVAITNKRMRLLALELETDHFRTEKWGSMPYTVVERVIHPRTGFVVDNEVERYSNGVLTLLSKETKTRLPDAILECSAIKRALKRGDITYQKQAPKKSRKQEG